MTVMPMFDQIDECLIVESADRTDESVLAVGADAAINTANLVLKTSETTLQLPIVRTKERQSGASVSRLSIPQDTCPLDLIDAILSTKKRFVAISVERISLINGEQINLGKLLERMGFSLVETDQGKIWLSPKEKIKWRIRPAHAVNIDDLLDLFFRVFNQRMSREEYQWKYAGGRGDGVVIEEDAVLIAHCGALHRNFSIRENVKKITQLVDVMVHPDFRGFLTRKNPFFLSVASCIELFGQQSFGFPNERHMRLGEKIGFYREVNQILEARWSPRKSDFFHFSNIVKLDSMCESISAEIDTLWKNCKKTYAQYTLGLRDAKWIEYRYFLKPANNYQIYCVRRKLTKKLVGILVVKKEGDKLELVDVICALNIFSEVVDYARGVAKQEGCLFLYTWTTEDRSADIFRNCVDVIDPKVKIPAVVWADPHCDQELRGFFLLPGDADFH